MSFLLGSHYAVAIILIVTALMAVVPFLLAKPTHLLFMAMVAPQQMILLSHFVSVAIALISGHYPDGYVPAGGGVFHLRRSGMASYDRCDAHGLIFRGTMTDYPHVEISAMNDEIERLRKQCQELYEAAMNNGYGFLEKEAENERLKEKLKDCQKRLKGAGMLGADEGVIAQSGERTS